MTGTVPFPSLTLAAWLHDLSPFLVRWSQNGGLRWYGLSYALGFVIAWVVLRELVRRGRTHVSQTFIGDALMYMVVGVVVGGRLGYVLLYEPSILTQVSRSFPFWGVLRMTDGGMAFHGGFAGVVVASLLLTARMKREHAALAKESFGTRFRHLTDLLAPSCTIGLGLGRVANFINGELLGKIVAQPGSPAPWWSVRFPQELYEHRDMVYSPEQRSLLDRTLLRFGGEEQSLSRVFETLHHATGTTKTELARDLAQVISARHPSQLYQACFEGIVLTAITFWAISRKATPGFVGAWYLIGYGVLRVVAEFFRLPDTHFAVARPFGLSRGQWFSAAMVVAGVLMLIWLRGKPRVLTGDVAPQAGVA
jgi:phosphatidylglycerol:prolipoprotein diacylglycerol transferase